MVDNYHKNGCVRMMKRYDASNALGTGVVEQSTVSLNLNHLDCGRV